MSTPLEVVITGDVSGAQTAVQTLSSELGRVAVEAQKTDSSLQQFGATFTQVANSGSKSIFILTEKLRELESAVFTEKDVLKVAAFNAEIEKTQKEINKLTNAGKSGFDDLGNAIKKTSSAGTTGFGNLSNVADKSTAAVAKTGISLTKAYSGLRQIANILPGIGIAGIFGLAFEAVTALADALFDLDKPHGLTAEQEAQKIKEAAEEAAKKEQEFAQAVDKASQSVISQAGKLSELRGALTSTSTDVQNLTDATVKQGLASFFFDQKNIAVQKLLSDQIKQQIDLRKKQNPLADVPEFRTNATFSKNPFTKQLEEDKTKIKEVNTLASDLGDSFVKLFDSSHKDKKEKDLETIGEVLSKLDIQIDFLNRKEIVLKNDQAKQKISAIESTIDHLLQKFGLNPNSPIILNLEAKIGGIQLEEIFKRISKSPNKVEVPAELKLDLPDFSKLAKAKINPKVQLFPTDDIIKAGEAQADFQKRQEAIADFVTSTLSPVFQNLFSSILDGTQTVFQALSNTLKQILVQIAATVLKALALAAIFSLFGLGGGASFSKLFNQFSGIPKFAGGVNNFGGGLAIVGERGPELVSLPRGSNVIPNNQIVGGGSTQVVIPQVVVRGQDLLIVFNQAQATNSRNG